MQPKLRGLLWFAGITLLAGCTKAPQGLPAPPPELAAVQVATHAVEQRTQPTFEDVVGTVRASLRATLEAKITGRITQLPVVLGQRIESGELLARLDAPEINARLEQAEAGLQQAERDLKRVSSLFTQQVATRAEFDTAEARHRVAKGAVAEARALMDSVEIRAPFDGVVTRKWANRGELATPGRPLVDLEDPTRLQIEADVPEGMGGKVLPGAWMRIRLSQEPTKIAGTVVEIAPIADPVSRTFRVKLDVANHPGLMSGQFVRLAVPISETLAMRVPTMAVVGRGQLEMVFAVKEERARMRLVRTGRQADGETEILSGLDVGDLVVVDDPRTLVDGQPLQRK
ncbi:MAG: efflux RND transporter periplasmic adaptor subunit [Verrucomicrobiales bacterium]|nr:efflux RND transporter periplasmic adaptor subunit [Verrucomicrobiales bacterium]